MGVLTKSEIDRRLADGELIINPRTVDGDFEIEAASYDLMAGIAVWNENRKSDDGNITVARYAPELPLVAQEVITLLPGQMMFVITHEDVKIPKDLCGTVFSRNKLAKEGILALNTGHIDPGYEGPILIRLISLRRTPWTLKLGDPIFTIEFHTLEVGSSPSGSPTLHPPITKDETLRAALNSATQGLSNPLYDVQAKNIEAIIEKRMEEAERKLEVSLAREFVKSSTVSSWVGIVGWVVGSLIGLAGLLLTALAMSGQLQALLRWLLGL